MKPHGTHTRYCAGCHCRPCRDGHNEHQRIRTRNIAYGRHEGLIDVTGSRRRLQALQAIGWPLQELSRRMGYSPDRLTCVMHRQSTITPRVARGIADLYDELWATPCPHWLAKRTILHARRKGYAPALAWNDDEIDDPDAVPDFGAKSRGPAPRMECGTAAAARRHYRNGEPLDHACAEAARLQRREAARRQRAREAS